MRCYRASEEWWTGHDQKLFDQAEARCSKKACACKADTVMVSSGEPVLRTMAGWGAKIAGFFLRNANSAGDSAFSTSAST
jgi:hypothetical protein